ncbi:hypothetical protein [Chromobacterium sphagni]|nr:hypothetical protein [Chromobacterium sphagni]
MIKPHLMFGPQGAGKSTHTRGAGQAVHLVIDDWMGQLYGPDLPQPLDFFWVMARVARRNAARGQTFAFEVTPAMFATMEAQFEPATADEFAMAEIVVTDQV